MITNRSVSGRAWRYTLRERGEGERGEKGVREIYGRGQRGAWEGVKEGERGERGRERCRREREDTNRCPEDVGFEALQQLPRMQLPQEVGGALYVCCLAIPQSGSMTLHLALEDTG